MFDDSVALKVPYMIRTLDACYAIIVILALILNRSSSGKNRLDSDLDFVRQQADVIVPNATKSQMTESGAN